MIHIEYLKKTETVDIWFYEALNQLESIFSILTVLSGEWAISLIILWISVQ